MVELYRTNNMIELSFLESLLSDAGIDYVITDQFTSVVEGSIGAIQRRVLINEADEMSARNLLKELDR
ncbi:putative signal transducing protein [Ponticaulis profundi]|uniref:DUF2007 domain-containing protein n=1 Tax=Ponticaulis profundi TaxID=2665222 RepID=A0ABW1S6H4_9PROT